MSPVYSSPYVVAVVPATGSSRLKLSVGRCCTTDRYERLFTMLKLPCSRRRSLVLGLSLVSMTSSPMAQGSPPDPFAPGIRWSHGADLAAPWIPRDVTFAAGDELLWTAPAIGETCESGPTRPIGP